ncbi:hypothetical protein BaRGS_00010380 [Batillaria attramentaria]|uniref:Secreted protein n=1 Tax=Batillaria attramentaria TaxID=370345 RepID=A0ABD0LGQ6_9CAEN
MAQGSLPPPWRRFRHYRACTLCETVSFLLLLARVTHGVIRSTPSCAVAVAGECGNWEGNRRFMQTASLAGYNQSQTSSVM